MCGIVGYVGKNKCLQPLIQGLKRLEYRGYDSAGVAFLDVKKKISICKTVGRVKSLEEKVDFETCGNIGIGHTRWATHGGVTEVNSHPHRIGNITIVHNGILENYLDLKMKLINEGYKLNSDTDTEVACGYIDYLYKKNMNIIRVLEECLQVFKGSFAIAGMVDGYNYLFVMKKDSPLIVACGEDGNYVASDILAYADNTYKYLSLCDGMIGIIRDDEIRIYEDGKEVEVKFEEVEKNIDTGELEGYDHYMLKEMAEQSTLVRKWYDNYFEGNKFAEVVDISKYKKIHIVGCGTAYHAGLIGKYLFEYYGDKEVNVFIASEYRYQRLFADENTLVIFVSQSGETADTIACIKRVKEYGVTSLGIVNVKNSSIARLVDNVIYTEASSEVAVASTKAYTAQIYVMSILALKMGIINKRVNLDSVKKEYLGLNKLIDEALEYDYSPIVDLIKDKTNLFYLGRNIDYVNMMEGALKLKEISYIHSEAFPAGELKHGTISLLSEGSCVIVMATLEDLVDKVVSNIKEVKARGSKVILLIREDLAAGIDKEASDILVRIPKTSYIIQPIVNVIYLQSIAYEVAKRLGRDIDKPRNLAKSVTVE